MPRIVNLLLNFKAEWSVNLGERKYFEWKIKKWFLLQGKEGFIAVKKL